MKKNVGFVLVVVVVLLLLAAGGYYFTSKQAQSPTEDVQQTEEKQNGAVISIQTAAGESAVHCVTDDSVGFITSEAIKLYNRSGKELLSQEIALTEPRVHTRGNCLIVYDRGGKNGIAIENGKVIYQPKVDESIVFAKINRNGYTLLVTQGTLHKNAVRVYNNKGNEIFKWNSGGLFVVNGDLSDDNQNFAVSTIDANVIPVGTTIYLFHTGKNTSTANAKFEDTIISNVVCSNGNYYGLSDNAMYVLSDNGTQLGAVDFTDRQLENFVIDGANAVLAFTASEFGINARGSAIEIYNVRGELVGQAQLDSDLKYLDCRDGTICVGDGEVIGLYNTKGVFRSNVDIQQNLKNFQLFGDAQYGAAFTSSSIEIVRCK